jgi:hypothetical protein
MGDLLDAVVTGEELVRDGHMVVNKIGEALYVDYERVTAEELRELASLKEGNLGMVF